MVELKYTNVDEGFLSYYGELWFNSLSFHQRAAYQTLNKFKSILYKNI